jgi:hypothetical protein
MSATSLKLNDFVVVHSQTLGRKVVGKITELVSEFVDIEFCCFKDPENVKFKIYSLPEHLPGKHILSSAHSITLSGKRMYYHSKFELVQTVDELEEPRQNVTKEVKVLRFIDFVKSYKNPREAFPDLADVQISDANLDDFRVFFFRQRINQGVYIPELKPSCVCNQVFNPDEDFIECPNCPGFMHLRCLRHEADRKCRDCKYEFPARDLYNIKKKENIKSGEDAQAF